MKLIKPAFEIIEQQAGLEGIYKMIELAGRTCYKSEDKITETSAKEFVDRLIKSGHTSVLEHGSIYLYIETGPEPSLMVKEIINFYKYNKYSHVNTKYILDKDQDSHTPLIIGYKYYISTNLRVCIENNRKEFLNPSLLCEPTEYHERRVTVHFICDRGVSHEFVRHRVFSFAQESTRYCNYSKNKFNNELTFIQPVWTYHQEDGDYGTLDTLKRKNRGNKDGTFYEFIKSLQYAELYYFRLLQEGWKPQEARAVLPNSLKTELVVTGFTSDWNHFFDLRARGTTGAPHPQTKELAEPLMREFVTRKYINN